jgi:hypothetical protein
MAMLSDHELLELGMNTRYVHDDQRRVLHDNSPGASRSPRMSVAGCASANVLRLRRDVGEDTARAIEALLADEPPLARPDSSPVHLDEYRHLLDAEGSDTLVRHGLAWVFPDPLHYRSDVELIGSDTSEAVQLLADLARDGMPRALVDLGFVNEAELWAPWCVVMWEGAIASIAFAARLSWSAAETGVATVPAFRGRGYAAAATAGWAALSSLSGRTLFYGTDRTNLSSQAVARRLGLRFLGSSFAIY